MTLLDSARDCFGRDSRCSAPLSRQPESRVQSQPLGERELFCCQFYRYLIQVDSKNETGSYQPLIDLIAGGQIKGIAAVVGCSNLSTKGHDVFTVELTKELIKRDIIVLSAGCTSGGLANCGLMLPEAAELAGDKLKGICKKLGIPPVLSFGPCLAIGRLEAVAAEIAGTLKVDLPQLPLAVSAPQWLEEQALADGAFALALGLLIHLGSPPFITGSELVTRVLTENIEGITGGKVLVEEDPAKAAEAISTHIVEKRSALGI